MMSLVDLPTEVLVQVFASLDSLRDAVNLSKTCSRFDRLLNYKWNIASIFDAITDNMVLPKTPNTAWLETHFEPDCVWKPSRSEIPPRVLHTETVGFLTTIGFPDRRAGLHGDDGIDLQWFRKDIEQHQNPTWPYIDIPRGQVLGVRYPEPYYHLGFFGDQNARVGCTSGRITSYIPSMCNGGRGTSTCINKTIMSFLVILGTAMSSRNAIKELIQRSSDPLKLAMGVWCLQKVYLKMQEYDLFLDELSRVWDDFLFDGVDYTEYSKGPFSTRRVLKYGLDSYAMGIGERLRFCLGTTGRTMSSV